MSINLIWAVGMRHHGFIKLLDGHRLEALGREVAANSVLNLAVKYKVSYGDVGYLGWR